MDEGRLQRIFRYLLAIFFVVAGINHFRDPRFYLMIMPPYLPWHSELVFISGVCEILGGIGVLFPHPLRRYAGWGLVALLVAVFPANLHMALHDIPMGGPGTPSNPWVNWLRLPLQLVFIFWVLWCTRPPSKT
jgi:uncharacterized membrane protein